MQTKIPKYRELDKIYHPDSCDPLIKAFKNGKIKFAGLKRFNYPGEELPDRVLPGVNSLGFWDAKIRQTWGLGWHRNEGIEFTFLSSGHLDFSLGKKEYFLKSGDLTITRPWQPHKVGNPNVEIGKLYWLIIDVGVRQPHQNWEWPDWVMLAQEDLNMLTKILRQNEKAVWMADNKIHQCFQKIGACLEESKYKIPHSKLNLLINELLLLVLEMFNNEKEEIKLDGTLTDNLRTAELFFEDLKNDYDRPWTLETMAVHCGLGITSLTKYSKQLTNLPPINYLNSIRLEAAAELLRNDNDKNIADICYECGFSSSQYFATAFRKMYKCTPKEFRLMVWETER
ncbi:AraC family transcriptional regulator [Cyclobacterium jeungdonense]|uniref:AraC family transcriptional regulator n=1 Tax=Cyclobacterium jeungdonense TaxID=708087 RepID=A0ABT8C631_9BACT|nr:AraC family transcriptional regulator [Cyclobacterium jeungdonense]MDN3688249.1 AraC family transcriptional regulator [Cyclobacterium jeungdonense]